MAPSPRRILTLTVLLWGHMGMVVQASYVAKWKEVADIPQQLSDMTATTVSDKVYVIGGCNDHQVACDWWDGCSYCPSVSDNVHVYTPSSDSWETLDDAMPRERYRHAAAVVDSSLYVIGGRDLDDNVISQVDVLDTDTNTWSTLKTANWTAPRSDEGTFVYDDKIFVGGGYDENYTSYATVDILDPSSGTWTYAKSSTTTASMSDSRGDFGFVEIKSKFYTFGGWSSDDWCSPRTSAEVYDPSTDEWTSLADLQKGRGDKAMGTLNGRLFAIGGEHNNNCNSGSTPVTDVEVYDPGQPSKGWVVESYIPEEKFRFAAATVSGKIFVFGGQKNMTHNCSGFDYCYPVSNHTWAFSESKSTKEKQPALNVLALSLGLVFGLLGLGLIIWAIFTGKLGKIPSGFSSQKATPDGSFKVPQGEEAAQNTELVQETELAKV